MEIQSEKLYKCLCTPGEMVCCGCLPLKTGVYIVIALDVAVGLLAAVTMGILMSHSFPVSGLTIGLHLLELAINVSAIPFAILGFTGLRNLLQPRLHFYSVYKQVQLPLILCVWSLFSLSFCGETQAECNFLTFAFVAVLRTAYNLYFIHIVWSADQFLMRNQTALVMHGKGALQLMRAQANSLETNSYVVVEPGQEPAHGSVGVEMQPSSSY